MSRWVQTEDERHIRHMVAVLRPNQIGLHSRRGLFLRPVAYEKHMLDDDEQQGGVKSLRVRIGKMKIRHATGAGKQERWLGGPPTDVDQFHFVPKDSSNSRSFRVNTIEMRRQTNLFIYSVLQWLPRKKSRNRCAYHPLASSSHEADILWCKSA